MPTKKTATKKKAPLEKDIINSIKQWLGIIPGIVWSDRLNSGTVQTAYKSWVKLCKKGTPDYIALVHDGKIAHILFIEAKRKGKIKKDGTSPVMEQNWFKEKVSGVDNIHYILIDEVIQMINKINDITYYYEKTTY